MSVEGTIFLDLDCVSQHYQVDSAKSPGLVRFVLDRDQELAGSLFEALDLVYPNYPWSSPGNSMMRRLCGWIFSLDDFPEVKGFSDGQRISDQIQYARELVNQAFISREFERHYCPDVHPAARLWTEQGYRVILFSNQNTERWRRMISEVPDLDLKVTPVLLETDDSATMLRDLAKHFPEDPERCFLIVGCSKYQAATAWRLKRIRTILVDRNWTQTPHLETGYSLYVTELTDIDPNKESEREYYHV